ncbi:MAG: hypothetical protein J6P19_02060, partial [Acetobacter sp.]|nr:hypothetical protein [Acetobacter sp.]
YAQKKLSIAGVDAYSREYQKIESKLVLDRQDLARDLQAISEFQQQYGIADYDVLYTRPLILLRNFKKKKFL